MNKELKQVIISSKNKAKTDAVKEGFSLAFPEIIHGYINHEAPSGVSDQPMSDEETLSGAKNRYAYVEEKYPDADYWAAIEGGCEKDDIGLSVFAWIVIGNKYHQSLSKTGLFYLPDEIISLMDEGYELGHACDLLFQTHGSKQQTGAVGLLTGDLINRTQYYEQAVILALIPFKNQVLFSHAVTS